MSTCKVNEKNSASASFAVSGGGEKKKASEAVAIAAIYHQKYQYHLRPHDRHCGEIETRLLKAGAVPSRREQPSSKSNHLFLYR